MHRREAMDDLQILRIASYHYCDFKFVVLWKYLWSLGFTVYLFLFFCSYDRVILNAWRLPRACILVWTYQFSYGD